MKKIILGLAVAGLFVVPSAFAAPATSPTQGEFGNHCAMGLVMGKQVKTDCSINWKDTAGKTYCFSSEQMKQEWSKNTATNISKAGSEFTKLSSVKPLTSEQKM